MNNIIYSKTAKKSLDSYDKKTALRIVKGIEGIPLGNIELYIPTKKILFK